MSEADIYADYETENAELIKSGTKKNKG